MPLPVARVLSEIWKDNQSCLKMAFLSKDRYNSAMKLIVGLGNPGKKYEHTRHNAGWLALDFLIADFGFRIADFGLNKKLEAEILRVRDDFFVKPQTFMNLSGKTVKAALDFYKLGAENQLLVIHDDSDLPLGAVRAVFDSSSAGHNGVQSVIDELGTQKFHRLRIGVETRASRNDLPTEAFVLRDFTDDELAKLKQDILPKVKSEVANFLRV